MEKEPVKVVVRIRPPMQENKVCISSINDNSLEITNHRNEHENSKYWFSRVFNDETEQEQVYHEAVEPLVNLVTQGYNASVLAYGQTGAGKTYTMMGPEDNIGIIPRALETVFNLIEADKLAHPDTVYSVKVSYLEIYQEKVIDLLSHTSKTKPATDLLIRQTPSKDILIPRLEEKTISSPGEFLQHFIRANDRRHVGATLLNEHSSRSHVIVLVKVTKGDGRMRSQGKLYLVDLAGCEDNRRTGNAGLRLKESGSINTSLFYLGQVIEALNHRSFAVPYRSSKLTRLLQDSLGGNSYSCIISCVGPEECNYFDTLRALKFSTKVEKVKNIVRANQEIIDKSLEPDTTSPPENSDSTADITVLSGVHNRSETFDISTVSNSSSCPTSAGISSPAMRFIESKLSDQFSRLEEKLVSQLKAEASMILEESMMLDRSFFQKPLEFTKARVTQAKEATRRALIEQPTPIPLSFGTAVKVPQQPKMSPPLASIESLLESTDEEQSPADRQKQNSTVDIRNSSISNITATQRKRFFPSVTDHNDSFDIQAPPTIFKQSTIRRRSSDRKDFSVLNESRNVTTSEASLINSDTELPANGDGRLLAIKPCSVNVSGINGSLKLVSNTVDLKNTRISADDTLGTDADVSTNENSFTEPCKKRKRKSSVAATDGENATAKRWNLRPRRSMILTQLDANIQVEKQQARNRRKPEKRMEKRCLGTSFQEKRKQTILRMMNTGSVKMLSTLPTLGQKRATMIYEYRHFKGNYGKVEDLKHVPGLPKTFYKNFARSNLIMDASESESNLSDIIEESDNSDFIPVAKKCAKNSRKTENTKTKARRSSRFTCNF